MIELGGNIELVGFNEVEPGKMVVLKKIIGSYVRKFSDNIEGYEKLTLNLKRVHGSKNEIQAKLMVSGKPVNTDITENNLFIAIADSLKKLESQTIKK